jgi:enoyl-CoA hydratase/3-hydroxyacyl-CoA dehydrogenase
MLASYLSCRAACRAVLCCAILQVLLDTLQLSSDIKKTPVVVGNCTGFAVNRVFFPYTMAACLLMDCGVNPFQV